MASADFCSASPRRLAERMDRAYSILQIKSFDEDSRTIEGLASSPELDRGGDIMEPRGAKFTLPMPFLWQHKADKPIGQVVAASVTPEGIRIRAVIAKGVLPFIDEAWSLIKSGLVSGLSIGWRPTEAPKAEARGVLRFTSWEWFETSAVTIPMNAATTISQIKSIDAPFLAASGEGQGTVARPSAGVTASVVRVSKGTAVMKKTYSEQIAAFEATRAANEARRTEIQSKASDEGRTKEAGEKEEFDRLGDENTKIDAELADLRAMEAREKTQAKPVAGADPSAAAAARSTSPSFVSVKTNTPPGFGFARFVRVKMAGFMERMSPVEIAKQWYPDDRLLHLALKAVVGASTTADADSAAALVYAQNLASEFIEFLRPDTIIGRFGTNGIPSLRRVPFNVRMVGQTTGGDGYWVGEGKPKPLTAFDFAATSLGFSKVAAIAVISNELARFSVPGAEGIIRDALRDAIVARIDTDFINPSKAAVSGVSPASITNGLTPMSSAGTSADNARTDVAKMLKTFLDENQKPSNAVFIMPAALAMSLGLMRNSLGNKEFPDLSMNGGSLEGIPVITTQYAALTGGPGNLVILLNASDILLADDGNVTVDVSDQASLEMLDAALVQDGTAGTGTSLVSLWQNNLLGLRAEREIAWKKRRAEAVVYMDDVNWGSIGSPA